MKLIKSIIGLFVVVILAAFVYVWMFMPDKKQEIKDRWYDMIIDCEQLRSEVSNHQRCERSDDCQLARKVRIRVEKLEAQYAKYCGER